MMAGWLRHRDFVALLGRYIRSRCEAAPRCSVHNGYDDVGLMRFPGQALAGHKRFQRRHRGRQDKYRPAHDRNSKP